MNLDFIQECLRGFKENERVAYDKRTSLSSRTSCKDQEKSY